MRFFHTMVAAIAAMAAAPSAAATLIVEGERLVGAQGVDVGGTLYDVEFLGGTCGSVFSGCDSNSDFAFSTSAQSQLAVQALLDQVFVGAYDTTPSLMRGCGGLVCYVVTPYYINSGSVTAIALTNNAGTAADNTFGATFPSTYHLSQHPYTNMVWGRFTLAAVSSVPEPSTWAMMLVGFGGIGFAMRRAKKADGKLAIA